MTMSLADIIRGKNGKNFFSKVKMEDLVQTRIGLEIDLSTIEKSVEKLEKEQSRLLKEGITASEMKRQRLYAQIRSIESNIKAKNRQYRQTMKWLNGVWGIINIIEEEKLINNSDVGKRLQGLSATDLKQFVERMEASRIRKNHVLEDVSTLLDSLDKDKDDFEDESMANDPIYNYWNDASKGKIDADVGAQEIIHGTATYQPYDDSE